MMRDTTVRTRPPSYPQRSNATRTCLLETSRARDAGEHFADWHADTSKPNGFVVQLMSDHMPACIVGRFSHAGLGEFRTGHIADSNTIGTPDNLGRDLVRPVLTGVFDLGVDGFDALFFARPLRHRQLIFVVAREVFPAVRLVHVRAGNLIFQAKVDPHRIQAKFQLRFVHHGALKIDVPASPVVLAEAAFFDCAFDLSRQPQAKEATGISDGITDELDAVGFERYPAQGTLAAAPPQTALAELLTLLCIFRTDTLNGMGMQTEFSGTASREFVQVVS